MRYLRIYGATALVPGVGLALVAFNLVSFWAEDGSDDLPVRVTAAGLTVVLVTVIGGTLILLRARRRGAGYSAGPRRTRTVPVRGGPDLPFRIRVALLALQAEIREADADTGRYAAETSPSRGSSGEHVTVELSGDPASPEARIASRPRSRFQLYDRGKGHRNVQSVVDALQE